MILFGTNWSWLFHLLSLWVVDGNWGFFVTVGFWFSTCWHLERWRITDIVLKSFGQLQQSEGRKNNFLANLPVRWPRPPATQKNLRGIIFRKVRNFPRIMLISMRPNGLSNTDFYPTNIIEIWLKFGQFLWGQKEDFFLDIRKLRIVLFGQIEGSFFVLILWD